MLSFEKAQCLIEKELQNLIFPGEPNNLYEPVKYILGIGGKRLRPALVLMATDLFGGDYYKAIKPAIALEVFHNFTLMHDDLMDNSTVRRGRSTVHVKWDQNTAILSGDVMSIIACRLILQSDEDFSVSVSNLFNKTAIEVCEGQMLDLDYSKKSSVSIPEYLNMIRLKTSVLIASSLGIGAIIAKTDKNNFELIYNLGINIGLLFQLQDDLLDSFGNQLTFGKKIGNDILTNKRTYLVIKAFEIAKGKDLSELNKYYSGIEFDPEEKIRAVIKIFNNLNIRQYTEDEINNFHTKAIKNLNEITLPSERKTEFSEFINFLINREK